MKKYVEIFWSPYYAVGLDNMVDMVYQVPKPFYSKLLTERPNSHYLKCPALSKQFANSFTINSPYDLNITFDYDKKEVYTDRFGQNYFDKQIINRTHQSPNNPFLVSLPMQYLFFTKENVEIELTEVPILNSISTENYRLIVGGFNISKWYRPIELAVEVKDPTKPISLKLNDPLALVKFTTPNDVPIKFTRVDLTPELRKMCRSSVDIKHYRPHLKLSENYKLAADYIEDFWRRYLK